MEESSVYRAIIARGEVLGVRKALLHLGKKHLGEPDDATRSAIESISDIERLEQLIERAMVVPDWETLLQSVPPRPKKRRRNGR